MGNLWQPLIIAALLTAGTSSVAWRAPAQTESNVTQVAVGTWILHEDKPVLTLGVGDQISAKQRNMINSGFTTFSVLRLALVPEGDGARVKEAKDIYRLACSVKFDTWEERYDIARLETQPFTHVVKDYSDYAGDCLTAALNQGELLKDLVRGGLLIATLNVKQASPEESDRVKDWLVRQQSGVMQNLFSHMIGELSLSEQVFVQVRIPPQPNFPRAAEAPKPMEKRPPQRPFVKGKG